MKQILSLDFFLGHRLMRGMNKATNTHRGLLIAARDVEEMHDLFHTSIKVQSPWGDVTQHTIRE